MLHNIITAQPYKYCSSRHGSYTKEILQELGRLKAYEAYIQAYNTTKTNNTHSCQHYAHQLIVPQGMILLYLWSSCPCSFNNSFSFIICTTALRAHSSFFLQFSHPHLFALNIHSVLYQKNHLLTKIFLTKRLPHLLTRK